MDRMNVMIAEQQEVRPLTTAELARAIGIKPVSIFIRLSRTGSFHGIRPERTPSRRLLWPADSVERLKEAGRTGRAVEEPEEDYRDPSAS